MQTSAPKVLFVPVSSTSGIGEYMRSVIVADEILRQWPKARIKFILNRHAPYAKDCKFDAILLDETPTKKVKEVNEIISDFKPNLVIFDASGRKSQLQHAQKEGAKVIFLSQHQRKRQRGMKIGRAKVTDSHWVVQPEFVIGPISRFSKFKLNLIGKPEPIFTGPIFTPPSHQNEVSLLTKYGLKRGEFLIFNAGSGGHKINSELAADIFFEAAIAAHKLSNLPCLMVFGSNYPKDIPQHLGVTCIKQMENVDFINLLNASKSAVISGGDTLLQSLALKKPTLAVPVSKDQPPRIQACLQQKIILAATGKADMLDSVRQLLMPETLQQLEENMQLNQCENGLTIGMKEITRLLGNQ